MESVKKEKLKLNLSSDKLKEILEKKRQESGVIIDNSKKKESLGKYFKPLSKDQPAKNPRKMTLNWLCKNYPKVFNIKLRHKPLKIKITEDIYQDLPKHFPKLKGNSLEDWKKNIKDAIKFYCAGTFYLEAVIKEKYRYTLAGEKHDAVTESDKSYAKNCLKNLKRKFEEKENEKSN